MSLPPPFAIAGLTHVGMVRERNEDSFMARPDVGLAAVADGMGGHDAGDLASAVVVSALEAIEPQPTPADLLRRCEEELLRANAKIREIAVSRHASVVGATVVVLLTFDRYYACLWAGDSRAYVVRRGEITQITRDHTEAAMLVADGVITLEEAENWPRHNVITRAVGASEELELDLENGELSPGDTFVLCSDGLTRHVEAREIALIVGRRAPKKACDELIELALRRGGQDNVTVVVLCYEPYAASPPM